MSDIFASYEKGLTQLLDRLGSDHLHYVESLTLQTRLLENLAQVRNFSDSENLRSERNRILEQLNRLTLKCLGVTFNQLCGLVSEPPLPQAVYQVVPLDAGLEVQEPPSHLSLPPGYRYLGQMDGLATDHLYREQDGHIVLWFPEMPGVSKPFLIDKYTITAQQFSDCLNDLLRQELILVDRHPTSGVQSCVDSQGHPLVFDALDRWQRGPTPHEPWLHTAVPWGMTCQQGVWQPVAGGELLPATLVTWWGAKLYSLWVHQQPIDLTEDGMVYLPTVQQWQMASLWDPSTRRQRRYPWGDSWQRETVNYAGYRAGCEVREADWERLWATQANTRRQTRPLPVADLDEGCSPTGCVQMIGNVWEWCADSPIGGASTSRAVKGGACLSPQEHCFPDRHVAWRPEQGNEYIGFRCCFPLMG
jgi:formylglycine-generating enzyme required for sulfatase activity